MDTTINPSLAHDAAADPNSPVDQADAAGETSALTRAAAFLRWPGLLLLALYLASRWFLISISPAGSDVPLYFVYGVAGRDLEAAPYSTDVVCEYPPLAYLHFYGIRALDPQRVGRLTDDPRTTREIVGEYARDPRNTARQAFAQRFRTSFLVVDLLIAAIGGLFVARRYGRAALFRCAVAYTLGTVVLAHIVYDRTDLMLALVFVSLAAAWLRLADRDDARGEQAPSAGYYFGVVAAYAILGLGTVYKLIPVLFVAPLLCCEAVAVLRRRPGALRSLLLAITTFATTVGLPFFWAAQNPGNDLSLLFGYHAERPIHVESVWGTVCLAWKSLQPLPLELVHSFNSYNFLGPLPETLRKLAPVAMLGGWLILVLCVLCRVRQYDRRAAFCAAAAGLIWSTLTAHVLSLQYLLWLLPVVALLAMELEARRFMKCLPLWTVAVAVCATYVFPYHFQAQAAAPGQRCAPRSFRISTTLPPWRSWPATLCLPPRACFSS
ncbi:MAG: hypothetical protein QM775_08030 [Pirellulales bacterium]